MNHETGASFGAPSAVGADDAADRIFLRDHVVSMEIGAYADEYGTEQRLRFNVDLEVRRFRLEDDDEVASIVSYDQIVDAIAGIAAGPRIKLLETFAERLAAQLLEDRRVGRAFIRIEKLDRVAGALGVEIVRTRLTLR
ncbi:MAG: dihydroneopterin aldolase [Pseudomonadota bacterium]